MKKLVVYEAESDTTRSFFCDVSVIRYAELGWALVRPDGSIHEFSPDWSFGGDVPYPAYRGWRWLRAIGGVSAMTKRHAVARAQIMPWYAYKLGGWEIAVDAMSKVDADRHITINAPGAKYVGEFTPGNIINGFSTATAMTTAKRQEEISQRMRE